MTTALIPRPVEALDGEIVGNGLFLEENPFLLGRFRWVEVAEGATLADHYRAAAAVLPPPYAPHIELWIDEAPVPREHWGKVKPKPGHTVYARVRPHGAGKGVKNVLRAVLMIAVIALATYFLGPAAFGAGGWLGLSMSAGLAAAASAVAIATVTTLGMLAINALIPAPGLTGENRHPKFQLTGTSNQFAPYGPVPRVFGKLRVFPVVAGHPYTEVVGNKQYLRLLLMVGWGPIKISDIRVGNTPISAFKNVEFEVTEGGPAGWSGNTPITLYNRKVHETQLSVELTNAGGASVQQTTGTGVIEIGVDLTFPFGLITMTKTGSTAARTVQVKVEYRPHGSGSWSNAPLETAYTDSAQSISGATITTTANSQDMVRATGRFKVTAGQYDVRLTRLTGDSTVGGSSTNVDRSFWTALREFTADQPVIQDQVCLIAIRMQATDQLNGTPNQINCLAEAYLPVLTAGTWNYALTRNPAWAYADVLRRRGGKTLIADNRIDAAGSIAAWAADCAATAPNATEPTWCFDAVIEGGTVFEALRQIAAVGRAAYTMRDGKFAVVQDKVQSTPVQLITPRNSWGYRGTRTFLKMPHAYRVEFQNADFDYAVDERIVYADGYDSTTATEFEVLQLFGCTSKTQAFRDARYHMAVAILRPEEHRISMDIEALRCTLGDRVQLAYDVMLVGAAYGRITSLALSGANTVGFTIDMDCEFFAGKTYQLRVRHSNGTISVRTVTNAGGVGVAALLTCAAETTAGGPAIGDIAIFGETSVESAPMIVKKIEAGDDLSATLTLTNYDPAVYTADTGTIPAFFSYIGTDVAKTPPLDPVVTIRGDGTTQLLNHNWVLQRLGVDIFNGSDRVPVVGNEVQFRKLYDTLWQDSGAGLAPLSKTTIYCNGVITGEAYQVRVRAKGENGLYSNYVQPADVVVIGSSMVPNAPGSPSVTPEYRSNIIRWTNPTDLDLEYVEVLASQTNSVGTAVVIGRDIAGTFTHQNLVGGAIWYYWLRAVDFAGNVSTPITYAGTGTALTIALYEGIGADSVLTPSEKLLIIQEWGKLGQEQAGLDASATAFGVTTEKTAYDSAYSTLNTYLTGLSPAYSDTTQNTTIVRSTWDAYWESLYTNRQALLNKIDAVASTMALWGGLTNPGGPVPPPTVTPGDNYQPDPDFGDASAVNPGGYGGAWTGSPGALRTSLP